MSVARKKPAAERPAKNSSLDGQPAPGTDYLRILSEVREANERLVIAGIHMQELAEEAHRKFHRATTGRDRVGIGLGLYVSQLIVEASDGRIWARSQLGKGSTFSFSLSAAG